MGDILPFAYPEMLKRTFPETFNGESQERYKVATVDVRLKVQNNNESRVHGKIAALIKDKTTVYFRVGSMLFTRTEGAGELISSSSDVNVPLERSVVVVPSGWVLCIDVDLHVKTGNDNSEANNLKATLDFSDSTPGTQDRTVRGDEVHVTVSYPEQGIQDYIDKQLSPPVQVKQSPPVQVLGMASTRPTIVYTVGDELSFIEFIMVLRRILADHQDHEDILDGHRLLNLSSTREHPVLARQCAEGPKRWIELQVVEGNDEMSSSTTLFMRDNNVYIHGFKNQQQVSYELLRKPPRNRKNDWRDQHMLPKEYSAQPLYWDLKYRTILGLESNGEVVRKLKDAGLGRDFMKKAVRVLSRYHDNSSEMDAARLALAGLIFMIAESARMNPVFKSFACRWNSNNGFTEQLMKDYVWDYYGRKSGELLRWKRTQYAEPVLAPHYPIEDLEAIYLVLNTTQGDAEKEENGKNHHKNPEDDPGNEASKRRRHSSYEDRRRHGRHLKGTRNDDDDWSGGRQSQRKKDSNAAGSGDAPGSCPGDGEAGDAGTGGGSRSRPEKADDAVSDGGSAASQPEKTDDGDASGGGGSASQSSGGSGAGGSDPSGGNSGSQRREADGAQYNGRPRVELLTMAIRPHLMVKGMTIVVFDGKRGQMIYYCEEEQGQQNSTKEEQGDQGEWEYLVLTGPDVGISAYGCFVIRIETPPGFAAPKPPIRWEWDCYKSEYAAQVDKSHFTKDIDDVAKVTYAVMSNAREATVQVKLRLKDGHIPSCISGGKISALIDGFEARSVLFKQAQGTGQCLSPTNDDSSWFLLELARNVVAVPCGRLLHIQVELQIVTQDGKEVEVKVPLRFDNGISSSKTDDGNEIGVEIEVTWYPEIPRPEDTREQIDQPELKLPAEVKMATEIVYTIGDEQSFTEFIADIRSILADHPDREDVLDEHPKFSSLSSTGQHPVLAKQRAEQPARWIQVKLQAMKGEEMLSTALLMRADNMYICGFMNHQGDSFELIDNTERSVDILPADNYNVQPLSWGVDYISLLDVDTDDDLARILATMNICRGFAMDAVHVLSCFPAWADGNMNPRMALAGLILMICESARINPIHNLIEIHWSDHNLKFTDDLMRDLVLKYGSFSRELLTWKSQGYTTNPNPTLQKQNIYLVLNSRMYRYPSRPGSSKSPGQPRVELFAMRADFEVVGTTITVFDGKQGHIIYRKEEQGEKGMVDLVLTGPCRGLSAYGCFAIKVDIPPAAGSSRGDASGSIKWEWDCYDPEYAKEVDQGPMSPRTISSGPGRNVKITYAVMSDAQEATVQVKLRLKDGNMPCIVHGDIIARIGDFRDPIILFRRTLETAQHFSPTAHADVLQVTRSLKLARNVVAVPCGMKLHIQGSLQIQTSNEQGVSEYPIDTHLSSDGSLNSMRGQNVNSDEQIEVTASGWYPDLGGSEVPHGKEKSLAEVATFQSSVVPHSEEKRQRQPDIWYKVGQDAQGFSTFITELRRLVGEHPRCKDLMADHPQRSSTHNHHPVLPIRVTREPEMLFHIKLEALVQGDTSSVTLVVRYDSLDVIGFITQNGVYYEHGEPDSLQRLLSKYKVKTPLTWGKDYGTILNARGRKEAEDIMAAVKMDKAFAEEAVQYLSRFRDVGPSDRAKRSLVGLMIMVCDSARMEPVHQAIAGGWSTKEGTVLAKEQRLKDYRRMWPAISGALLNWRDHAYQGWPENKELETIGIKSPEDARQVAHLVFNDDERICKY